MPLNPIQFGNDVINQFGRYLKTTFPFADPDLAAQMDDALRHQLGGEPLLYRGPYVTLNRPFEPGPTLKELIKELGLHPALAGTFPFETLHKHQELALRAIIAGHHTILSTGTGSGKTEAFLLPVFEHLLQLRDSNAPSGVVAVLVYPMNALVNDQLERLRRTLVGTRITFGRYTGETRERAGDEQNQLSEPRQYTPEELRAADEDGEALPYPWEECVDRRSIQERRPRILLTNYSQLEYLLLRDRDLDLFQGAPLRFLVLDEVHTYTGELGSEVACLIRRLREVANKEPGDVICVGTSATVTDARESETQIDGEAVTRTFAHRLFGVPEEEITFITEHYRQIDEPATLYTPPTQPDVEALLGQILQAASEMHQHDELGEPPGELLSLAEALCGRSAPLAGDVRQRLHGLLASNRVVRRLGALLTHPTLLTDLLPALRQFDGHEHLEEHALTAEVMALLTLGAIAEQDGEPLLRPKIHYFVQGLQGLYVSFEVDALALHFEKKTGVSDTNNLLFPLYICRSCGQHFTQVINGEQDAIEIENHASGYFPGRVVDRGEAPGTNESLHTLTNRLHTQEEDEEDTIGRMYLCRVCASLHTEQEDHCLNPKCQSAQPLIPMMAWENEPTRCPACGSMNWGNARRITRAQSTEVSDITILSQSMLAAMPEHQMQKLLIFADNRQDAAFQAGWMEERSKRFRMRHLLYRLLEADKTRIWGFDDLVEELISEAVAEKIMPSAQWSDNANRTRTKWFLLEEFASPTQQRSSLERLGLAEVWYKDLTDEVDPEFFSSWARVFGCSSQQVVDIVWILIDHYRQRGFLSEPLLARSWSPQDREVREGWIATAEYYRPQAVVRESKGKSGYLKSWLASNGRSAAQAIVKSVVPQGAAQTDRFLKDLWQWLLRNQLLVQVELKQRRYGKIEKINISQDVYQVNVDKVGVKETSERWVCDICGRAVSRVTPNRSCPGYNCRGHLSLTARDEDHYDVVQYTRMQFVPMRSYEHSAQVRKETRERVEREFKKDNGQYNTIVATPTLEMGVDIGKLEMVLMRNVPPTPSNYAQRAGRAGRRHRVAVVFSYARGNQHDRYFFGNPPEMISGQIRVPVFSMHNAPLIRKHVHSATLTSLRQLCLGDELGILDEAFPGYIWGYFGEHISTTDGEYRFKYRNTSLRLQAFDNLVRKYHDQILERLVQAFYASWPDEERDTAVSRDTLSQYIAEMAGQLERQCLLLFEEIQAYRRALGKIRQTEQQYSLSDEEKTLKYRFEHALKKYQEESLENWSLSYLSNVGFLPGYAMGQESIVARSLNPFLQLSRPASVALREFTPGNFIYADRHVFQIQTLNFYKLSTKDKEWSPSLLVRNLAVDRKGHRVFDPAHESMEGGDRHPVRFVSYELTDVEMDPLQDIDDRHDYRQRLALDIYGMVLADHQGGFGGRVGGREYRFLRQEHIRLVNLGPTRAGSASPGIGFPICPNCGETRNPKSSDVEIQEFREGHQKRCRVRDIVWAAIHVDFPSDVLFIGPYNTDAEAINVFEGVRIGARMVLDMGENEVEGFAAADSSSQWWAVLYDPLPGGSGFLPEISGYWEHIIEGALNVLGSCDCETSCYKCMRHFRNQQYHELYNRFDAIALLKEVYNKASDRYEIPAVSAPETVVRQGADAGSTAEEMFIGILETRGFPLPDEQQYQADLGGKDFTVSDFAYTVAKVLIFIDGLSENLHGDPDRAQRDRIKRAKARMSGYQILEIPAAALQDTVMLNGKLEELALYLGHSPN